MDYTAYIVKTLSTSMGKIIPLLVSLALGYVVFFKLPFFLFRRTLVVSKHTPPEPHPVLEETPKAKPRPEPKREEKKEQHQAPPKKPSPAPGFSPEAVFNLKPGETFTKGELKKRYHELLKGCHPDKVAALDPEFKKLADKRTKDINMAYEKLKSRAA
jgi:DnaJ like chaperone protein